MNWIKMKTKSKISKENPASLIKKVELIYNKDWETFMVKITIKGQTIFYPVVYKETGHGNNIQNR
jgi:hypothetical protein